VCLEQNNYSCRITVFLACRYLFSAAGNAAAGYSVQIGDRVFCCNNFNECCGFNFRQVDEPVLGSKEKQFITAKLKM